MSETPIFQGFTVSRALFITIGFMGATGAVVVVVGSGGRVEVDHSVSVGAAYSTCWAMVLTSMTEEVTAKVATIISRSLRIRRQCGV